MKTILKRLLLCAAIGLPLWALSRSLPEVASVASGLNGWLVALVFFGLVLYTVFNASVWADVLQGLGHRAGKLKATRLWIECEAMKWLPGGIWGYASRVVKAPELGVSRKTAGASLAIELLLTIAAWSVIALIGLALDHTMRDQVFSLFTPLLEQIGSRYWMLWTGFGLLLIPLAHPTVRKRLLEQVGSLSGMCQQIAPLFRAFASYLTLCFLHAILLALLVGAVSQNGISFSSAMAADGGAWLIGFFAIGVPGGIGVREAGITWFLAAHITTPEAMTVAVLWRALQIGAELSTLAASKLVSHRSVKPVTAIDLSVKIS